MNKATRSERTDFMLISGEGDVVSVERVTDQELEIDIEQCLNALKTVTMRRLAELNASSTAAEASPTITS